MNRRPNLLFSMFILAALMLGGAWGLSTLVAGTRPTLNATETTIVAVKPLRNYQVLFNSATVDNSGTPITNPYAFSTWSTVAKDCNTSGGRLLVLSDLKASDRVEIITLFTASGATAAVQLFGFDYVDAADVPTANATSLVQLGSTARNLGLPYPVSLDGGLSALSITASSFIVKGTVTGNVFYVDQTSGTTYYVGTRQIFDAAGMFAWCPFVNTISSGTVVILGRIL